MSLSNKELEALLKDLEGQIKHLRTEYEKFFMGLIRVEPIRERKRIKTTLLRSTGRPINNTSIRFRFQQLQGQFNTYQTYWDRILKQIEEGRYHREKNRYRLKKEQNIEPAAQTRKTNQTKGKSMDALYSEFLNSRQKCGESVKNVSKERLAAFVSTQKRAIQSKYGDRQVDFKVVVENGKTKLKAILKK